MKLSHRDPRRDPNEHKTPPKESVVGPSAQKYKNFAFVFDLESVSYTRQFERPSGQGDMQSEQLQSYLLDILNSTRVEKQRDLKDEVWDDGIRTMVLMGDGQVVDVNDLEEEAEEDAQGGLGVKGDVNNRADELASVKSQEERLARMIKVGDAISERGTERSLESKKVTDIKIKGLVDSMEDSRSQVRKLLLKRIGKSSLVLFLVIVLLYMVLSILTTGSFWLTVGAHFKSIKNKVQLSSSKSQLTTSIAKSTITLGLLSLSNAGVKFGVDGSDTAQASYFSAQVEEFLYAIDQIDIASRAISAQIFELADQTVIADWTNDGTTQMEFGETSSTATSSSLVNAYQIATSQNLQLKASNPSQFSLSNSSIQQLQRAVHQSVLPQSWQMSEHMLTAYETILSREKSTLYVIVILNYLVILMPTIAILITLVRVGYRRNSICKVYYYFAIDDVKDICAKVDEYLGLMKNRETGTVLSLSFALKETSQANEDTADDDENRSRTFKKNKKGAQNAESEGLESILVQKSIASKYVTRLFRRTDIFFLCLGSLFTIGVAVYMSVYCMELVSDSNYMVGLISGVYRYQQRTWTALATFTNLYLGPAKANITLVPLLLKDTEEYLTKSKLEINPFLEMPTFLESSLSLYQGKFVQDICSMSLNVSSYTKSNCKAVTPTLTQQGLLYSLLDLPFSLSQLLIYSGTFTSKTNFNCPQAGLSPPSAFADPAIATRFGCLLNNDTTIDVFDFGLTYSHRLYRIMWEGILSEYTALSDTGSRDNLNTAVIMILGIFLLTVAWIVVFVRDEVYFRNSLSMVFNVPSNTLKKNQRLQKMLMSQTV